MPTGGFCHLCVQDSTVHQFAGPLKRSARPVRLLAQERVQPLAVDVGAPACPVDVGDRELKKEVA